MCVLRLLRLYFEATVRYVKVNSISRSVLHELVNGNLRLFKTRWMRPQSFRFVVQLLWLQLLRTPSTDQTQHQCFSIGMILIEAM
jgi:hypothetical protein